jgi:hypothetical protein
MIEVFKTNIEPAKAKPVIKLLAQSFPKYKIDVDLEDCDKVLRIEGEYIDVKMVIAVLKEEGFKCTVLNN